MTFSHALKYGRTAEHGAEREWKMWKMFRTCQHLPREPKLQADTLVKSNQKKRAFWQSFHTFTVSPHTKIPEEPFAPQDLNALPRGSRLTENKSSHIFPRAQQLQHLPWKGASGALTCIILVPIYPYSLKLPTICWIAYRFILQFSTLCHYCLSTDKQARECLQRSSNSSGHTQLSHLEIISH